MSTILEDGSIRRFLRKRGWLKNRLFERIPPIKRENVKRLTTDQLRELFRRYKRMFDDFDRELTERMAEEQNLAREIKRLEFYFLPLLFLMAVKIR
jgi:hypothetical protein